MEKFIFLAQLTVAISVVYVWIFRFGNIVKEFNQFGLSELIRSSVGVMKISLATLLVAGIWYPSLIFVPSILMGLLMVAAQYFHFKVGNPMVKHFPSMLLLILCAFIAWVSAQYP